MGKSKKLLLENVRIIGDSHLWIIGDSHLLNKEGEMKIDITMVVCEIL